MKTLFFGTPDFAVPMLEVLADHSEVGAVVCQPDRVSGRGLKLRPPPVKVAAEARGLQVWQPRSVRRGVFLEKVRELAPELAVVAAYGKILPAGLLDILPRGFVNVHASLLPRLRGAAPVHRAILEGESSSGVAIMRVTEGLDEGPVLLDQEISIGPEETAGELHDRLMALGRELLGRYLELLRDDREPAARAQDDAGSTYAPKLEPGEGALDWSRPAVAVDRHIRGLSPWPGAYARFRGKRLVLLRSRLTTGEGAPGRILRLESEGPVVACGEGAVLLLELKPAGKRAMAGVDWVRGARLQEGESLGPGEDA